MKNMIFFHLLSLGLIFQLASSEEVSIIDTRKATSDLDWPSTPGGWTELTATDETDVDLRTFEVCKIHRSGQNNWFHTPYLNGAGAKKIFIEIRFSIRSCEEIEEYSSCKETFNLYYLPSNSNSSWKAEMLNDRTYIKLDTIAAGTRFDQSLFASFIETRTITSLPTKGFYVAFQDTGACMSILHIRIYYKICPEVVANLANFPVTKTGSSFESLVKADGKCIENSEQVDTSSAPVMQCNSEGNWIIPSGMCQCSKGHSPDQNSSRCIKCPVGLYKMLSSNSDCLLCPENSYSAVAGASFCGCFFGYFRAPDDGLDTPCTQPPSAPISPRSTVFGSSIFITWSKPQEDGGRMDLSYRIVCEQCDRLYFNCNLCPDVIEYSPGSSSIYHERVTIRKVEPNSFYKFKIISHNGVSDLTTNPSFVSLEVSTVIPAPQTVTNLQVTSSAKDQVTLEWSPPSGSQTSIESYQLQCNDGRRTQSFETEETKFKLTELKPGKTYKFKVRAKNSGGYGRFSLPIEYKTENNSIQTDEISKEHLPPSVSNKDHPSKPLDDTTTTTHSAGENDYFILAIAVSCSLVIFGLVIFVFVCVKQKRLKYSSKNEFSKYPVFDNATELISSLYVDPYTYEDPYLAVMKFTKELNHRTIHVEDTIRSGEFGDVCKGTINLHFKKKVVAIKTLKTGYTDQQKLDFLTEASIMGQFDHPNVIRLEGVISKSRPLMIVMEYMNNGALDLLLRKLKEKLLSNRLLQMLHDVAVGMNYLSQFGYVHRDLAARNILIDSSYRCKISDFGMSRCLEKNSSEDLAIYSGGGGVIPIRWSAPEAISDRIFTSSSDVWSYGILMWEILSYGERPYWEMPNRDVIHFVQCGYRLPPPTRCPRVLHNLMLECWNSVYAQRPKFEHLVTLIEHFQLDPTLLDAKVNRCSMRFQDDCIPEVMDLSSLSRWLEEIHLIHYKPLLLSHGCVTAEQIMSLNKEELESMGIVDHNDVNTILQEAEILRFKIEEVNKIGVAV